MRTPMIRDTRYAFTHKCFENGKQEQNRSDKSHTFGEPTKLKNIVSVPFAPPV